MRSKPDHKAQDGPLLLRELDVDPRLSSLRSLALVALADRSGDALSQAQVAARFGIAESTLSAHLKQVKDHYGPSLRERESVNGETASDLSPLGKVLGNHAIQLWAYDCLLTSLLDPKSFGRNVDALGEEFFYDLFKYLEDGASFALGLLEFADKYLHMPQTGEERSDEETFVKDETGRLISIAERSRRSAEEARSQEERGKRGSFRDWHKRHLAKNALGKGEAGPHEDESA